jgi:hypothetical protein
MALRKEAPSRATPAPWLNATTAAIMTGRKRGKHRSDLLVNHGANGTSRIREYQKIYDAAVNKGRTLGNDQNPIFGESIMCYTPLTATKAIGSNMIVVAKLPPQP